MFLAAIVGLGVLMMVHEAGHYFAARAFGMRVTKFSLGMPPTLFKIQPKGSPTTFQIGAIPFFAYVQIAGMNPVEEIDPNDKGSYANASLLGRIVTIFAGSAANYVFASIFFFFSMVLAGQQVLTTNIEHVIPNDPAAKAGLMDGDKVLEVEGAPVTSWDQFRGTVTKRPGQPTTVVVERKGERIPVTVTPVAAAEGGEGRIGAVAATERKPVPVAEAAKISLLMPPTVVYELVTGLAKVITGKEKAQLGGPAKILSEGARAAKRGVGDYLQFLAFISANLAAFNLLPFPALDGGRLIFLGYEAVSRRRPDAMVEAHVHLVGFVMLLALMLVVTWNDLFGKH